MRARALSISDLDAKSFRAIADLAYRESGLTLVKEKSPMIQSRLRHRLRDLGLSDFAAYCTLIQSDEGKSERRHLISALTTNVSHFFRENHHFGVLKDEVDRCLPRLRTGGSMRIWSAGCSNGQEALSAAITLLEHVPEITKYDVRILATDIDPQVVDFARAGTYTDRQIGGVLPALLAKHFDRSDETLRETRYTARPDLMGMIRFNELNLLSEWPMTKPIDVIFCRNVVIYFDLKTQETLWPGFGKSLSPDGVLFLGHAERMAGPEKFGFRCTGPTTYRPITARPR